MSITALIFSYKSKTISPFGPKLRLWGCWFIEAVSSSDKKDQDKGAEVSTGFCGHLSFSLDLCHSTEHHFTLFVCF